MTAQDTMVRSGWMMLDLLASYLNFFGNEALARLLAIVVVLCAVALAALPILWIWRWLGKMSSPGKSKIEMPKPVSKEANIYVARGTRADLVSTEMQDIRGAFDIAIGAIAEESRKQEIRILRSHDEISTTLSRIEGVLGDLASKVDGVGQGEAINARLESAILSIATLSEKLPVSGRESEATFVRIPPAAKFSAEIADIVRELRAR